MNRARSAQGEAGGASDCSPGAAIEDVATIEIAAAAKSEFLLFDLA